MPISMREFIKLIRALGGYLWNLIIGYWWKVFTALAAILGLSTILKIEVPLWIWW